MSAAPIKITWLRMQMLVPLSMSCCWKYFTSSGVAVAVAVAVSGERPSQAADRLQARRWLVWDAGPRLRDIISAIIRARRGVIGVDC